MRMDFAFGKTGLGTTLPDGYNYRVLEARSAQPLPDPAAAIEEFYFRDFKDSFGDFEPGRWYGTGLFPPRPKPRNA